MKWISLYVILISVISPLAYAQEDSGRKAQYHEVFSTGYDGSQMAFHIRPEGRYSEIKGSPYLQEEWVQGRILLKGDSIVANFSMRFNVYGNEMQFINGPDTFSIANPLHVGSVLLGTRRFEYLPFNLGLNENMAWFEIMGEGRLRLLVRYSVRLEKGVEPVTPYHCNNAVDRFVRGKFFYYQSLEMEKPIELPDTRNEFLKVPDLTRVGLKEYFRERRINLRSEEDLVELFGWINNQNEMK